MTRKKFSRIISILLSVMMVLGNVAFALPVLDSVESIQDSLGLASDNAETMASNSLVWDFEDESSQNWTSTDPSATLTYANGCATFTRTAENTGSMHLGDNLGLNASDFDYMVFKVKANDTTTKRIQIDVRGNIANGAANIFYNAYGLSTDFQEIVVNLNTSANWAGSTVSYINLNPLGTTGTGSIVVDEIAFYAAEDYDIKFIDPSNDLRTAGPTWEPGGQSRLWAGEQGTYIQHTNPASIDTSYKYLVLTMIQYSTSSSQFASGLNMFLRTVDASDGSSNAKQADYYVPVVQEASHYGLYVIDLENAFSMWSSDKEVTHLRFYVATAAGVAQTGSKFLDFGPIYFTNNLPYETHTVTFNVNGSATSETVRDGTIIAEPSRPSLDGYYFKHWSETENGETAFDFEQPITKDTTLYAVFGVAGVLTSWDFEDASSQVWVGYQWYPDQGGLDVTYSDGAANINQTAAGDGRSFKITGLDLDADNWNYLVVKVKSPDGSVPRLNIDVRGNLTGGAGNIWYNNIISNIGKDYQTFVIDLNASATWAGSTIDSLAFLMVAANGGDIAGKYSVDEIYFASEQPQLYTVTFNANDEVYATQSIASGDKAYAPANPTSASASKVFKHWSETENGETAFDFEQSITKNTTLYAVFEAVEEITWDFEDASSQVWVGYQWDPAAGGLEVAYSDGAANITQTAAGDGRSFKITGLDLDADDWNYLVVKVKSPDGSVPRLNLDVRGSLSGGAGNIWYTSIRNIEKDYQTYVIDLNSSATWAGSTINSLAFLMIGDNGGDIAGKYTVDEISFLKTYTAPAITSWNFSDVASKSFVMKGSGNTMTYANGEATWTQTTAGAGYPQYNLPVAIEADDYRYLVIRAKSSNLTSFYFDFRGTLSNGAANIVVYVKDISASYKTIVIDLSEKANWAGSTITYFSMIQADPSQGVMAGTIVLDEFYFTNELPEVDTTVRVESGTLTASSNTIKEDRGTVTLTPVFKYNNDEEVPADVLKTVMYSTDTVNASITKNADGTATVTGQIDGDVVVSATIPGTDVTATVALTISGQAARVVKDAYKVMMYGHSWRSHGPAPAIGWNGQGWGMAASSEDKDYAHRFIYYMNQKFGANSTTLVDASTHSHGSTFEGAIAGKGSNYTYENEIAPYKAQVLEQQPDIITFTIGGNVANSVTYEEFYNAYYNLIKALKEAAPNATIVISCVETRDSLKGSVIYDVAAAHGIGVADHSYINQDRKYQAWDASWIVPETSDGVKGHPGDLGMDSIGNDLFEKVNYELTTNKPVTYTTPVTAVEIIAPATKIETAYGTIQLSAEISPATADNDVIWSVDNKDIGTVDETGLVTARNNGTLTVTAKSRIVETVYDTIEIEISGQTTPFTVTYDKNTEDAVDGMPEANDLAKEGFVLSTEYPSRATYNFVGWSLTADGEVVTTIDVTADTTVYAIWEKATKWTFDRDGYFEGFTVTHGFNPRVLDGSLNAFTYAADIAIGDLLKFSSPVLDVDASEYASLVIKSLNTAVTDASTATLNIMTASGTKSYTVPVTSTEYTQYEFSLEDVGTITGFEFIPANVSECTVQIDEIYFAKAPAVRYNTNTTDTVTGMPANVYNEEGVITLSTTVPVRAGYTFLGWSLAADSKLLYDEVSTGEATVDVYAVWDKNDHWEMDSSSDARIYSADTATFENGILTIEVTGPNASPRDINVYLEKDKAYNVNTTSKKIEVKAKLTFADDIAPSADLFVGTDRAELSGATRVGNTYGVTGSSDGFVTMTLDLSTNSAILGVIEKLRFDAFQETAGKMEIDYVRFTDSEANILISNGETLSLAENDTWASYIVKEGGKLAPQGAVTLKYLSTLGEVDTTNGYITIAKDGKYEGNLKLISLDDFDTTGYDYMMISGIDTALALDNSVNYLVDVSDGIGFVTFGNTTNADNKAVYKVTEDAVTAMDAPLTSSTESSIRATEPIAVRFKASVTNAMLASTEAVNGYTVEEYGFLVSTEAKLASAKDLTLTALAEGKAVSGIAYGKDENGNSVNKIYEATTDEVIFAAVMKNIPDTKEAYTTKLFVRPYIKLSNGTTIYGNPVSRSVYEICYDIVMTSTDYEADYYAYAYNVFEMCYEG